MATVNLFVREDLTEEEIRIFGPVRRSKLRTVSAGPAASGGLAVLGISTEGDDLNLFVDEGAAYTIAEKALAAYEELRRIRTGGRIEEYGGG